MARINQQKSRAQRTNGKATPNNYARAAKAKGKNPRKLSLRSREAIERVKKNKSTPNVVRVVNRKRTNVNNKKTVGTINRRTRSMSGPKMTTVNNKKTIGTFNRRPRSVIGPAMTMQERLRINSTKNAAGARVFNARSGPSTSINTRMNKRLIPSYRPIMGNRASNNMSRIITRNTRGFSKTPNYMNSIRSTKKLV